MRNTDLKVEGDNMHDEKKEPGERNLKNLFSFDDFDE